MSKIDCIDFQDRTQPTARVMIRFADDEIDTSVALPYGRASDTPLNSVEALQNILRRKPKNDGSSMRASGW